MNSRTYYAWDNAVKRYNVGVFRIELFLQHVYLLNIYNFITTFIVKDEPIFVVLAVSKQDFDVTDITAQEQFSLK